VTVVILLLGEPFHDTRFHMRCFTLHIARRPISIYGRPKKICPNSRLEVKYSKNDRPGVKYDYNGCPGAHTTER
jgi:hypothetical protein